MIRNNVVTNGMALTVPAHVSLGEYFLERFLNNIDRDGDAVALVNGNTGDQIKYSELLQDMVNIGIGLKQLGMGRGDVVAFHGETRVETFAAVLGTICCGATVTMFNIFNTKAELEHVLNISKPRVIFCSMTALEANVSLFNSTSSIEHIIQINGDPIERGLVSLREVMGNGDPRSYEPEPVCGATDTAAILYSSGTTGLPKGVMLTHLGILYECASFKGYSFETTKRALSVLPWYHVFGLVTTMGHLACHKEVIQLSGFNPEKYLSTIEEYQVNCLFLVPTVVVYLAKSALVEKYDVSSVQSMLCGAAPLSQNTAEIMSTRFPNLTKLIQAYGMTETTLGVLKDIDELDCEAGYLPVPGCKLKVVDIVTGEKLGPNQDGEICVKGPSIMKGYVDNEAATKAAFDAEGFLKTGDIGFYDEKGHFSIIDRLKEIIKYKGHQVAPATIESVILRHSSVADCAVVGKPDAMAVELPTAFVVIKPGEHLTAEQILEFTADKLSPLARLRGGVIFVDEIPKNSTGKILRRLLKQRLTENE